MTIKLYGAEISPCVRSVLLTIEALQLTNVEIVTVDLLNGGTQTARFSAINPLRTVPTIQDEDLILWDSHAINAYLVNKYSPNNSLYPTNPQERALIDAMNQFDTGYLFAGHDILIKSIVSSTRPTSIDPQLAQPLEDAYNYLEQILAKRSYVAGPQLTIADFSIATTLSSSENTVPLQPEKHDRILKWFQKIKALPYFAKVNSSGLDQKNPCHTVPLLEDGDFVLWDSHAINAYLANKYANNDGFYPKDPQKRALVDSMAHFDNTYLFGRGVEMINVIFTQDKSVDMEKIKNKIQEGYDFLELILEKRKFVAGDQMTIADFSIVATLSTNELYVPLNKEKYRKISAWYGKMKALPYYSINEKGIEVFKKVFGPLFAVPYGIKI